MKELRISGTGELRRLGRRISIRSESAKLEAELNMTTDDIREIYTQIQKIDRKLHRLEYEFENRLYVESSVCTTPFPLTKADTVFSARCRRVMTLEYDGTVTPSTVTESESENIDSFIAFSADIASLTFAVSRSVFSLNEFILAIALVLLY